MAEKRVRKSRRVKRRSEKSSVETSVKIEGVEVSGGSATFKLTKQDINEVFNFIKPYSSVVVSVMVIVKEDEVIFAQNQDGVLGVVVFKDVEFVEKPKNPFSFMMPRDLISNIKTLVKNDIEVAVDGTALDIILGGTDLAMLTSEDEAPEIDLSVDLSDSIALHSDILRDAVSRVSVIRTSGIGTLFPAISVGSSILGGSDIFFTEVKLGEKIDKPFNIPQEFMPFFQTVIKDGYKSIHISDTDKGLVVSDGKIFYMVRGISEVFPTTVETITSGRKHIYSATVDKRSLSKVIETLDIVLYGVANPYVTIETNKKGEMVFKAVSLGGRTSSDVVKTVDAKGSLLKNPVKIKSYFMHSIIKGGLDNILHIKVYDDFASISDETQTVVFALMNE